MGFCRRVTRLARGTGRPGHEPDGQGKTDRNPRCAYDDAGSGSLRRLRVHPQEGYLGRQRESLPTRVEGLPPLPPAFAASLDAGLVEFGIDLPGDRRRAIEDHVRLLLAWNAAINLTAIREPGAIAQRHVLDSLTALPLLRARRVARFLDLGSGGGFPGLPLAIALPAQALLVDSVGKKARFLEVVVDALRLEGAGGVGVLASRAEALAADARQRESWPAVTARAVGSLGDLVELAFPLLATGGVLVAWKRGDLAAELDAARRAGAALGGARVTVEGPHLAALPEHRLVVVTKEGGTGPEWPREPSLRRRAPW